MRKAEVVSKQIIGDSCHKRGIRRQPARMVVGMSILKIDRCGSMTYNGVGRKQSHLEEVLNHVDNQQRRQN